MEERRALTDIVGQDLSLPVVVMKMVGSEKARKAVSSFCGSVMTKKEEAERVRRREEEEAARRREEEREDSGGEVDTPPSPPTPSPRGRRRYPAGGLCPSRNAETG